MASGDARPVPIRALAYRVYFPILDADGDLVTGATSNTPDSERSIDGATFADCTNEMVEVATASGIYYLDLTAAEMTSDCTVVIAKTAAAGAKTTVIVLYPQAIGDIKVDVQSIANDQVAANNQAAALNLSKTTAAIGRGQVSSLTTTTNIVTASFTPVGVVGTVNQFKGRVITFDADTTTTALRGATTDILSSTAAANPEFGVTILPITPVPGDTFSVT